MTTYLHEQRPAAPAIREPRTDKGLAARYLNIVAGAWLFISAFLWKDNAPSQLNSWVVGALIMVFAAIAILVPPARFLDSALSLWLFFSTLVFFHLMGAALWNNVIVATIVFLASLVPGHAVGPGLRPRQHAGVRAPRGHWRRPVGG